MQHLIRLQSSYVSTELSIKKYHALSYRVSRATHSLFYYHLTLHSLNICTVAVIMLQFLRPTTFEFELSILNSITVNVD